MEEYQDKPAALPRETAGRRFSHIGFALLAMVLLHYATATAVSFVVGMVAPALMENSWALSCMSFLPSYFVAVPAAALLMRKLPPLPPRDIPRRRVSPEVFLLLLFAAYAMMIALNALGGRINELVEQWKGGQVANPLDNYFGDGNSPWILLPFFLVGAPLTEEIVFRGLLHRHLGAFGARTYILFSAVTFAMYHANLPQILYAFALGLLLAGLTYYTGNIKASVALHMALNCMGSVVPGFVMAYGGERGETLWGFGVLACGALGLAAGAVLFLRRRRLHFEPGSVAAPGARLVYANGGMTALLLTLGALTLWTMFFA